MVHVRQFRVVREFIGGILEGLTYEGITETEYKVGQEVLKPILNSSPYRIISVQEIEPKIYEGVN